MFEPRSTLLIASAPFIICVYLEFEPRSSLLIAAALFVTEFIQLFFLLMIFVLLHYSFIDSILEFRFVDKG